MKVERVDHIHAYVSDVEGAKRLFSAVLGGEFRDIGTFDGEGEHFFSTFHPLGLELISPTSAESHVAKVIQKRGQGMSCLTLKVDNIDESTKELESLGVRLVGKQYGGGLKEHLFHPKDSYGIQIELAEYSPIAPCIAARELGRPAARASNVLKVEKIDHVHAYVSDVEGAKRLFSAILGSEFRDLGAFNGVGEQFFATFHPLGLELISPTSAESHVAKVIQKRGQGLSCMTLKVDNIDESTKELESLGVRLVGRQYGGGLKEHLFHPKDSYGIQIELAEYCPIAPCLAAREMGLARANQ